MMMFTPYVLLCIALHSFYHSSYMTDNASMVTEGLSLKLKGHVHQPDQDLFLVLGVHFGASLCCPIHQALTGAA
jgi:hypothetical protein